MYKVKLSFFFSSILNLKFVQKLQQLNLRSCFEESAGICIYIRCNHKLPSSLIKLIEQVQVMGSTWFNYSPFIFCRLSVQSWKYQALKLQANRTFANFLKSLVKFNQQEEIVISWSIWKLTRATECHYFLIQPQ